jgi:hypothetical protein
MMSPGVNVLMSSFAAACSLVFADDLREFLVVDEQRLGRFLHFAPRADWRRSAGSKSGSRAPASRARRLALMVPSPLRPPAAARESSRRAFVRQFGERRDRLHLDPVFLPLQHRQQVFDALLIADFADARITVGSDFASPAPSISMKRGSALVLPISASASTARSLTHQSLSLVASISCATARSSLV